jgi:hypothetical protein
VADVIAGRNALPIVAMVWDFATWQAGNPNDVRFYIYDNDGARLNKVALDSGGDKYLPQLCLPCHGGYYFDTGTTVTVDNANFLPFDTDSFKYSTLPGFTLAAQAEKFRQLNAMVYDTDPYPSIVQLIDGWYGGASTVKVPNQPFNGNFVPAAYANTAANTTLYLEVVKPYCRTCHLVMPFLQFSSPNDFNAFNYGPSVRSDVYSSFIMPHAEITAHNFWSSNAPAALARSRAADPTSGWEPYVWRVSQTADRGPSGCVTGDCALRDAVVDASSNPGLNIIVFDVDGTFTLTEPNTVGGIDLLEGDLDLMGTIVILGNGPDKTIVDGNSLDRVFHLHPGAEVIIQGVTIRSGSASGSGGGILNEGGKLVLNDSVVRNNTSTADGAGIANAGGGSLEVNRSTLGPGNATATGRGGGLFNGDSGSRAVLNNTTVSGNAAESGGGLYNLAAGAVMTVTHSTIAANTATSVGGGVRNNGGTAALQNSIVSGNLGVSSPDCAAVTSLGHNVFGQSGSSNGCAAGESDRVPAGGVDTVINAQLSGGALPFHALNPIGPAIDAVPLGNGCALPSYDEQNQPRPLDGNLDGVAACDAGAVESAALPTRLFLPVVQR